MLLRDNNAVHTIRFFSWAAAMVLSAKLYWFSLDGYLSDLTNPAPMKFVLGVSLFLALIYDLYDAKKNKPRASAAVLATCLIFAVSPWVATEYRELYLHAIGEFKAMEEAANLLGHEYVRAVDNPAVGMGACFGLALASLRIPFKTVLARLLTALVAPEGVRQACPHCGQVADIG
jgi:hypothetical protein